MRDSGIDTIVGSHAGYAFTERNDRLYGSNGWRVWYLARGATTPLELDHGVAQSSPTLAMDDERLVWAAFDAPTEPLGPNPLDVGVSRLQLVNLERPTRRVPLLSFHLRDGLIWYPYLNGSELWYGVIHGDWENGIQDEYHLESLDLGASGPAAARAYPGIGREFEPVVNATYLFFKRAGPGFAALNWGQLWAVERSTLAETPIHGEMSRPSLGSRFLTFQEITYTKVYLYDFGRRSLQILESYPLSGTTRVGGQSLAGNLLTFLRGDATSPSRIVWGIVPGPE